MRGLTDMDKKIIEEKANKVLRDFNYTGGEVDIISLVKTYGFIVGNANLPNDDDGFILVEKGAGNKLNVNSDKIIGVNRKRGLFDKRFTIAHEIGHYILNNGNEQEIFAHRENKKGKCEEENDIDYFAACLLMPKEDFTKELKNLESLGYREGYIVEFLKEKYKVPPLSVIRRIQEVLV